jgi:hypothetical protein
MFDVITRAFAASVCAIAGLFRHIGVLSLMAGPKGRVTNQVLENMIEWHCALTTPPIAGVFSVQDEMNKATPPGFGPLLAA